MKLTTIKSLVAIAMVAVGFAAVAAPKVTIGKIWNGSVWSTKKVTYTISDVPTAASDVSYELAFDVTAYGVTTNIKMGVAQNGTFTYTLDTAAIFGETRKDPQAKFRVSIEAKWDLDPVQLWEGGPYFAKCNVGASAPHEFGYYFWWGDTVGYVRNAANNGWVSSKDGTTPIAFLNSPPANSTYEKNLATLKSLGYIDNTEIPLLTAAHDAATAHLGAPWRMPTAAEWGALVRNCTTAWTDNWNNTGVKGLIVTGMGAYASKSIFLPAAGNAVWEGVTDSQGKYWVPDPHTNGENPERYADEFFFSSEEVSLNTSTGRMYGLTIRPVR